MDPQRIVSLVPSHTESLHDLGLAARVVGRTRFCVHPQPWVESVPHVGGTKDADLQRILDLRPGLVVLDKDENPIALVEALQDAQVPVLWSEIDTIEDAADFLEELGSRCGVPDAGRDAAQAVRAALAEVQGGSVGAGETEKATGGTGPGGTAQDEPLDTVGVAREGVPVFCPIWYDPWMTFNHTAYPHAVLEAVGLHNVFGSRRGDKYFEVHPDEVTASDAAWTLLPTEPFPFHRQLERVDTAPLGPAGAPDRVRVIDGEALTWFGTRTAQGLRLLSEERDAMAASATI